MRGREVYLGLGSASCHTIMWLFHFVPPVQRAARAVDRWFLGETYLVSNACISLGSSDAMRCQSQSSVVAYPAVLASHLPLQPPQKPTTAKQKCCYCSCSRCQQKHGQVESQWVCARFSSVGRGNLCRCATKQLSSAFLSLIPPPCAPLLLCPCILRYHWSRVRLHPEEPQDDRGPESRLLDREKHQPPGIQAGHHVPECHRHQAHRGGVQAAAVHPPQHPPAEGVRLFCHLEGGEVQALWLPVLEGVAARPAAAQPECWRWLEWKLLLPVRHQPGPCPEEKEPVERAAWPTGYRGRVSHSQRNSPGHRVKGQAPSQALLDVPVLWDLLQQQQQTQGQAPGCGWVQVGHSSLQAGLRKAWGAGGSGQKSTWAPTSTGSCSCPLPLQ